MWAFVEEALWDVDDDYDDYGGDDDDDDDDEDDDMWSLNFVLLAFLQKIIFTHQFELFLHHAFCNLARFVVMLGE